MGLLFIIILIFTIFLYFVRKFGYIDFIQVLLLFIVCVLLAILIYMQMCPENLRNYLFFQLQLDAVLVNLPSEIIDPIKIKSLSSIIDKSVGEVLSNVTNQLMDILSQKPVDNSDQFKEQIQILRNMDQKLQTSNTISEVQLQQHAVASLIETNQLDTLQKSVDYQTQVLSKDINNPKGVLNSLDIIKQNTKPTLNIYGELQKNNVNTAQTNNLLTEGFRSMLQAENKGELATQFTNLGNIIEKNFIEYQTKVDGAIDAVQKSTANEIAEAKQQVEQINKAADFKIAIAEQEKNKALETATNMVNDYRMHENLGTKSHKMVSFNSTETAADNTATHTVAGIGLFALGIIFSWIF